MNEVLTTREIHRTFVTGTETLHVLKGINISAYKGEVLAIVGPSGAGKSTLLHILGGLDRPTEGEVILDGTPLFSHSDRELASIRNKEIGFVFQFHHLLPEFTAVENVMMPGLIGGSNYEDLLEPCREMLDAVGLRGRADHKPSELSGGEKQRVAVSRALIMNPKIVLADELTGNLDYSSSRSLWSLIFRLRDDRGLTFIVVTHNEELARRCDRLFRLVDGQVMAQNDM